MPDVYSLFLDRVGSFTDIQKLSIKEIEQDNNCLIIAPTGSGKTEAAILPILKKLEDQKKEGICAIYITPLRALNRDLMKRLEFVCNQVDISIGVRHGDTNKKEREEQAKKPPMLLITTPESMQNILLSPRLRDSIKNLKYVVVDELHELYYNKRGAQLAVVLERFSEISAEFVRIGISATVGNYKEAERFLFGEKKHKVIVSEVEKKISVEIKLPLIPVNKHDGFRASFDLDDPAMARIETVGEIIKSHQASLIFANTRQAVESIGSRLLFLGRLEGFDYVGVHHSSLDKNERIDIENNFKEGKLKSIIATSSLELGIDIGRIDIVVQYGSPRQASRLLQRVGRSGHREKLVSKGIIVVSGVLEAIEAGSTIFSAEEKKIESHEIENCPLDVLANQISAMALEYKKINFKKMFDIIKKSSSFSSMKIETFVEVLEFMNSIKTISFNEGFVLIGPISRKYFIKNISVIPDTPRFIVKQISTNRIISTLDERFVYSSVEEGYSFITKGIPWKVIKIEENTIYVEQSAEIEAAIPDWEGEDIPVSKDIAQQTITLFNNTEELFRVINKDSIKNIESFILKQKSFFLPSNDIIYVEEFDDYIIFYLSLGTLGNGFFSRKIALTLKEFGMDVVVKPTPYAIIIDFRFSRKRPDIEKLFINIMNDKTDAASLNESELFKYKFIQVAKLFGIVEKDATLTKNVVNKLLMFYKNTVIYKEALRDVEKNYIDYNAVSEFRKFYLSGRIVLKRIRSGSPLSAEILKSGLGYKEFLSEANPGEEEINFFIKKFNKKDLSLLCTYCGMQFSKKIEFETNDAEKILCIRCKSPMIATNKDDYSNAITKRLSGKKLSGSERESYENCLKEAGLISAYSWRAVVALLTYGVGLSTAGRILKMLRPTNEKFIADVINAQRTFVKNSRFWKK